MFTRMGEIDRIFGAMDLLRNKMDQVFEGFDRRGEVGSGWISRSGGPRTNLYEDGDKFEIIAEVPGIAKEDLNLKIQGNYLELSGSRSINTPEGYKVHRTERTPGSFLRSFTLPSDVDADRVEATLKEGILRLTLPKSEAAKPKQITIA
ncbi:MAG: Hsp20/alpha crystallin family protein [Pseudomonadota bacterium]